MTDFKCKICGKEIKSVYSLTGHVLKVHKLKIKDYYDTYLKSDSEGKCEVCGKPTKFKSVLKGYLPFCSVKCSGSSERLKEERKATTIERYGVAVTFNSQESRKKREKTNLEKYGSLSPFGNAEIRDKIKKNNLKKYGTEYPLQNEEVFNKTREKLKETYGVDNPGKSKELTDKRLKTLKSKQDSYEIENKLTKLSVLGALYGQGWYKSRDKLGIELVHENNLTYIHNEDIPKIKNYFNHYGCGHKSWLEKEIHDYIKSIYGGTIICNSRKIIPPHELDFYIPDLKLAIEFNGTYWHSTETGTPVNYHFEKSKACQDKNIRLIHIYEYEWLDYGDKIKLMLNEAFGIVNKIYARQCEIRKISNQEAKVLNEKVHLQGHRNAKVTYGLFYNNELVQLMSFDNCRYNRNIKNDDEWEIIRGCPGSNTSVVGGVSKLFSHFIEDYKPKKIISYCDFNKFDGKSYEKIGMKFVKYTGPDKKIIVNGKVISRNPKKYSQYKNNNKIFGSGSKLYVWEAK